MNITVCIKQTPDSSSVYIDPISGQVDYERFVQVLDAADACAVEAAVRLKEHFGGTVTAIYAWAEGGRGRIARGARHRRGCCCAAMECIGRNMGAIHGCGSIIGLYEK